MTDRIEAAARAMWARIEDEVTFDEAKAANDAPYQWAMEDARLAIEAADAAAGDAPITLTYTNWRGEAADRTIIPRHVWFGSTEWHPEPQWLLRATDVEKNAERDFALKDFSADASLAGVAGAIRVKPLSWIIVGHDAVAKSPVGPYEILKAGGFWAIFVNSENTAISRHDNMGDAKAAAQADYERRIRSALAGPEVTPSSAGTFQDRVAAVHIPLFDGDPTDVPERRARFFEESGETVQAFGMTREEARALVDYTWGRPAGEPPKEIGACVVTLASLCVVSGHEMMACAEADLAKLSRPESIARVRAKRATRHGRGPLPGLDPEGK